MAVGKIVDGITSSANSALFFPTQKTSGDPAVAQVEITGTASVVLVGRSDTDAPWSEIATFTSTDMVGIVLAPEMRFESTISTGAVSAWVME